MPHMLKHIVLALFLVLASFGPVTANAEISLAVYSGTVFTENTDVRLTQAGGTDLTFKNVSWDDESFETPIFWGVRLTWWLENSPEWGLALEFAHPKMLAKLDEVVDVSGTRAGTPVNTSEPLSNTFSHFEFTDGYNLLTFGLFHRWGHERKKRYSFVPYLGVGAGVAIPYVETTISGVDTREYQVTGLAVQAMAGTEFFITNPFSLFIEYKLNYSDMTADLDDGGTLRLEPTTHLFMFGGQWHFY